MKASKAALIPFLAACLTASGEPVAVKSAGTPAIPAQALPTTIGEMSEMARQKRIAEETKPVAAAAPQAGATVPQGLTIVPSTAILTSGAADTGGNKTPAKKAKPTPPPEVLPAVLAIAKTASGVRYAEMTDANVENKYIVGQVTPSGWTVFSIGSQYVELTKPAEKKKQERRLTLSLSNP